MIIWEWISKKWVLLREMIKVINIRWDFFKKCKPWWCDNINLNHAEIITLWTEFNFLILSWLWLIMIFHNFSNLCGKPSKCQIWKEYSAHYGYIDVFNLVAYSAVLTGVPDCDRWRASVDGAWSALLWCRHWHTAHRHRLHPTRNPKRWHLPGLW
jgi:hypothetical protein